MARNVNSRSSHGHLRERGDLPGDGERPGQRGASGPGGRGRWFVVGGGFVAIIGLPVHESDPAPGAGPLFVDGRNALLMLAARYRSDRAAFATRLPTAYRPAAPSTTNATRSASPRAGTLAPGGASDTIMRGHDSGAREVGYGRASS